MAAVDAAAASSRSSSKPSLTDLISSYAILPTLASWISTLDLYHLALVNRAHFSYILASQNVFKTLSRQCLCDGRGLADRQEFRRVFSLSPFSYVHGNSRKIHEDEEIEVRLYNVKCDEADALPCIKCGINLCEECRYYPRVQRRSPLRRPHLNSSWQLENVMCLCPSCDAKLEEELAGQFLNELCDCDRFERWICSKCVREDHKFTRDYFDKHTKWEWYAEDEGDTPTKFMTDHQFNRALWCMCGKEVEADTRPRCTWCKRRHLPESEWDNEWKQVGSKMPWIDNDPCYPHWVTDGQGNYPWPYPELPYSRLAKGNTFT
ncbi:hypothetical protein B0T10DRAFT_410925 [Thelonectria olida]|uniref:Uncharacterized protein n=1 Tax=Thelonectria olida TaxID=1576542 RepID=A0A9P9AKQ2_9HYPO|nr:hypothetical protein B0T10DRAFT_410925 [Thelonectria olida]